MTLEPLISQTINARPTHVQRPHSSEVKATLVDPLYDSDWDRLVRGHSQSSVFHSSAWAGVLAKTYGHKPFYLHFVSRGETMALLPLMEVSSPFTGSRGICLPFSDFCEPLTFDGCKSGVVMAKLTELAKERRWKYFEIRGGKNFRGEAGPAATFYGHKLDLRGGLETVLSRFANRARGAIRKAEKIGLSSQTSSSKEVLLEFYKLHVQTRRRHGVPPQPLSFFLNIYKSIIKSGLGFVVLARYKSKPVAAAVFFHLGKTALYKFAASDATLQELRGNNLVLWEGIRFLVEQHSESLHFGRTSLDNNGLRQFKLSWGAEEEMIEYSRLDTSTGQWVSGRNGGGPGLHQKIFSKLPLAMNRLAGSMVYPHLD